MTIIISIMLFLASIIGRIAFLAYAAYALVASSIPCLPFMRAGATSPNPFRETNFYGDTAMGPDRVALLESPVDGLNVRLRLFQQAGSSLDIVCHTIHSGISTDAFFDEVVQAASRGVQVRLLLDGKASAIRPAVNTLLEAMDAHPNIECRYYNPMNLLAPWKWHFLMHDKFIVVDGEYLLLGGRNIGDKFFAVADYAGKLSNDRDVLVWRAGETSPKTPSAVDQTSAYFETLWQYKDTKPLSGKRAMRPSRQENILGALHSSAARLGAEYPDYYRMTLPEFLAMTEPTRKVTLIHNPVDTQRKEPWIWEQLTRLALNAKESVVFQTPYVTANRDILATMEAASGKIDLSILTNSAASTPNYPAYSNYFAQRHKFVATDVNIYEYQAMHSIHGKAMVVDDRLGVIGSFNMDDRSMHLDTEVMLVIDSGAFAGKLDSAIDVYKRQSLRVDSDNTYAVPAGVEQAPVPTLKIPMLRFVSLFSGPLRAFI